MSKTKPRDKRLHVLKKMPELHHSIPGEEFDFRKSEVIQWMTSQPEILNYLFEKAKLSKLIEYNPESGTWHGVDNKPILKGAEYDERRF